MRGNGIIRDKNISAQRSLAQDPSAIFETTNKTQKPVDEKSREVATSTNRFDNTQVILSNHDQENPATLKGFGNLADSFQANVNRSGTTIAGDYG